MSGLAHPFLGPDHVLAMVAVGLFAGLSGGRARWAYPAAFLAGMATGFWHDYSELADTFELDRRFEPSMDGDRVDALYAGWRRAVDRTRDWVLH